jgi:two-component system, cell cycle sensor histidine kinase and response regulator CckA
MITSDVSDANARRWMIVDDDPASLLLMREIITRLGGVSIECFSSSQSALTAFETNPESFDLVVTDFQMPGMDGVELSRRLLMRSPRIKILLMTGSHLISHDAIVAQGLCGLLQKPLSFIALERALGMVSSSIPAAPPAGA